MTTTSNQHQTTFTFRTKFKGFLNENDFLNITEIFENFCKSSSATAFDILWRLTYSTDVANKEIYDLGIKSEKFSPEKILLFRNELRYQYEQRWTNSIETNFESPIKEAYSALKNKSDSIVANIVYRHCYAAKNYSDINRILYLLMSEKEQNYFGGIRALNFNMKEAEYLKPYHIEIHNLLQEVHNAFNSEEFNELPFYMGEEEKNVENNPVKNNEIEEEMSRYKNLTPEEIFKNKDIFKSFVENVDIELLNSIIHLGFDLNEVSTKREEIFNLIKAVESF